jgi:hypothetical protein
MMNGKSTCTYRCIDGRMFIEMNLNDGNFLEFISWLMEEPIK